MKKVRLLFALIWVVASSTVSADDVDLFQRLQQPTDQVSPSQLLEDLQLIEQPDAPSDFSDSYPAQYMDPNDFDDLSLRLVEQEAVPAESATLATNALAQNEVEPDFESSAEGIVDEGQIIDPTGEDAGVACGCGEVPIPEVSWSPAPAATGCCTDIGAGNRGCQTGCRRQSAPSCICKCTMPACRSGHGCHFARLLHQGKQRGCHSAGGQSCSGLAHSCSGNHLLRHIRCCR